MQSDEKCPCTSGKNYASCCQPLHLGEAAATPEALMRSRYSAYVVKLEDYLKLTWHPATCPDQLHLDASPKWARLKIIHSQQQGDQGQVHFKAFFRSSQGMQHLEEVSDFTLFEGRWVYLSGQVT